MAKKSDYVRVTIRIPKSTYDAIVGYLNSTFRFKGKDLPLYATKNLNQVIVDYIHKGMADIEDEEDEGKV